MDSKYNEEQPESTPSYGSDDQESGMEMLSHPRCLSAIPGEVQELMDEDQESGLEMLSHPRCLSAIPGEVQEMLVDEDSESESE